MTGPSGLSNDVGLVPLKEVENGSFIRRSVWRNEAAKFLDEAHIPAGRKDADPARGRNDFKSVRDSAGHEQKRARASATNPALHAKLHLSLEEVPTLVECSMNVHRWARLKRALVVDD